MTARVCIKTEMYLYHNQLIVIGYKISRGPSSLGVSPDQEEVNLTLLSELYIVEASDPIHCN